MTRLFRPAPTFMGAPAAASAAGSRAVVIGMPFDCGTHPVRIGSRQGPAAIREQSALLRAWDPATSRNPLAELNVVDLGDAVVTPSLVESPSPGSRPPSGTRSMRARCRSPWAATVR